MSGHMDYFGGAVSGPDQIPQIVATLKAAGVDVIKVVGTGGELTAYSDPLSCQFSDQELERIVRESARMATRFPATRTPTLASDRP